MLNWSVMLSSEGNGVIDVERAITGADQKEYAD